MKQKKAQEPKLHLSTWTDSTGRRRWQAIDNGTPVMPEQDTRSAVLARLVSEAQGWPVWNGDAARWDSPLDWQQSP